MQAGGQADADANEASVGIARMSNSAGGTAAAAECGGAIEGREAAAAAEEIYKGENGATTSKRKFLQRLICLQNPGERERARELVRTAQPKISSAE